MSYIRLDGEKIREARELRRKMKGRNARCIDCMYLMDYDKDHYRCGFMGFLIPKPKGIDYRYIYAKRKCPYFKPKAEG